MLAVVVPAVIVHVLLWNRVEVRVLERGGGCDATARVEGYHAAEEVEAVFVELPRSCVYFDAQVVRRWHGSMSADVNTRLPKAGPHRRESRRAVAEVVRKVSRFGGGGKQFLRRWGGARYEASRANLGMGTSRACPAHRVENRLAFSSRRYAPIMHA